MSRENDAGGCQPTPEQELLLRAALSQGEAALEAWDSWRRRAHLDRLDGESFALLPLLYVNLHRYPIADPPIEKLKGIYRLAWYKNQVLFRDAGVLLAKLHEAGVETVLLGDAALATSCYAEAGARPVPAFDILVRPGQAPRAIALLEQEGWRPEGRARAGSAAKLIGATHACLFANDAGRRVNLQWHALRECRQEGAEDHLWRGAVPVRVGDVPALALSRTDLLLHVCAQALTWAPVPPARWVADAISVLGPAGAAIDWPRLVQQAKQRRLALCLAAALAYLRERWSAPIPPAALQELRKMPVSRMERLEFGARMRPPSLATRLVLYAADYLRLVSDASPKQKALGLPLYLRRRYQSARWHRRR